MTYYFYKNTLFYIVIPIIGLKLVAGNCNGSVSVGCLRNILPSHFITLRTQSNLERFYLK